MSRKIFEFLPEILATLSVRWLTLKILKQAALFSLGGSAYVTLELLYRGFSHGSMFAAGGVCFLALGQSRKLSLPKPLLPCLGAGIITSVELMTGLLVNRNYGVWDYRGQPGNFLGQICPVFSLLWIPVSAGALVFYRWADGALTRLLPAQAGKGNRGREGGGNRNGESSEESG